MMENKILDRWLVCRPAQTGGVGRVALADVPMLPYPTFAEGMRALLIEADGSFSETNRCVAYFAVRDEQSGGLAFYALVAREAEADVLVAGHVLDYYHEGFPESLAKDIPALHVFEREIAELYGVHFSGAPWDKPLRYPFNRHHRDDSIDTYPFYSIDSRELHEVHVGPVHAGIIEPGAFRFLCDGERIVHLEIALGYQHRGVESLIAATPNRLRQILLGAVQDGDPMPSRRELAAHQILFLCQMIALSEKNLNMLLCQMDMPG